MIARAGALALIVALGASGLALAQSGRSGRLRPYADPGSVIAAEIAFNRLAQDKGQWTAFRATAADGAAMFVPRRVDARAWLARRADPPIPVRWQPHAAWVSCDGAYAVTRGGWRRQDSAGWFVTVWQRQAKGGYKWVLDVGDALATPAEAPEMISGLVADCPARGAPGDAGGPPPKAHKPIVVPLADPASARAPDGSLRWNAALDPRGAGTVTVEIMRGGVYQEVVREPVAPQG